MGGSDPERMAPLRCAQYITHAFQAHPEIKVTVVTDPTEILNEYPLMHAVVRASLEVSRHRPAVVKLEYHSPDPKSVKENLFFIGKGVTYDTGGADVKAGGLDFLKHTPFDPWFDKQLYRNYERHVSG